MMFVVLVFVVLYGLADEATDGMLSIYLLKAVGCLILVVLLCTLIRAC